MEMFLSEKSQTVASLGTFALKGVSYAEQRCHEDIFFKIDIHISFIKSTGIEVPCLRNHLSQDQCRFFSSVVDTLSTIAPLVSSRIGRNLPFYNASAT